tara:strand:+ start:136 stop:291 length:156 start_codon:yes stop_codon:yes gene_type:complete
MLIDDFDAYLLKFDINTVLEWNTDNMRKYRAYVEERFPNFDVLNNLMFLDK